MYGKGVIGTRESESKMISTCTHTAILAIDTRVTARHLCDVSVVENVITGYRLVDGDEVAEWGPGDVVAMDPVETIGAPVWGDVLVAQRVADDVLRANGWYRDDAWETTDGLALYAPVEAF